MIVRDFERTHKHRFAQSARPCHLLFFPATPANTNIAHFERHSEGYIISRQRRWIEEICFHSMAKVSGTSHKVSNAHTQTAHKREREIANITYNTVRSLTRPQPIPDECENARAPFYWYNLVMVFQRRNNIKFQSINIMFVYCKFDIIFPHFFSVALVGVCSASARGVPPFHFVARARACTQHTRDVPQPRTLACMSMCVGSALLKLLDCGENHKVTLHRYGKFKTDRFPPIDSSASKCQTLRKCCLRCCGTIDDDVRLFVIFLFAVLPSGS